MRRSNTNPPTPRSSLWCKPPPSLPDQRCKHFSVAAETQLASVLYLIIPFRLKSNQLSPSSTMVPLHQTPTLHRLASLPPTKIGKYLTLKPRWCTNTLATSCHTSCSCLPIFDWLPPWQPIHSSCKPSLNNLPASNPSYQWPHLLIRLFHQS